MSEQPKSTGAAAGVGTGAGVGKGGGAGVEEEQQEPDRSRSRSSKSRSANGGPGVGLGVGQRLRTAVLKTEICVGRASARMARIRSNRNNITMRKDISLAINRKEPDTR